MTFPREGKFTSSHFFASKDVMGTQRALRDRLMSRGKNCLPTVSRQFLTRNYPRPKLSPKMPPKLSLPHKRGLFILFQN